MIFKTITDETTISGQKIVTALQTRKIAQQEATAQLEADIACLKEYQIACQNGTVTTEQFDTIMKKASTSAVEYSAKIKAGTGSAQSYANAQKATNLALREVSIGANIASKAVKLFSATLNMLIFTAIIQGVAAFINQVDEWIVTAKEAKEAADAFKNSLSSFFSETQSNLKTISSLSDRFNELSKNVDANGKKISGTEEEYEEYLNICNQIKDIMPDLVSGYTAEGDAIVSLQGKVDSLTESYKGAIRAKASLFVTDGDENGKSIDDFFDDYNKFVNGDQGLFFKLSPFPNSSSDYYKEYYGYDYIHRWLSLVKDASIEELNNLGSLSVELRSGTVGGMYLRSLLEESELDINNVTTKNYNAIHDALNREFAVIEKEMSDRVLNIRLAFQNMLYADADYWQIDDENVLSAINSLYASIDAEYIKQNELFSKSALQSFESNFISLFNNDATKQAMVDFYTPIADDESINEFIERLNSSLKIIQTYCNENGITVPIAITEDTDALVNNYQKMLRSATRQAIGASDDEIISQRINPLQYQKYWETYKAIENFAKEHSINTQDEIATFQEALDEANYDIEQAFENYLKKKGELFSGFDITTHEKSIDDFQSKLKTLGDTLSSIRSGTFEDSDLTDLLQEFPELADKTDDLETAIVELINNALQALYDTLGENIPDGLKTSLQELADIASGTAKHLGDAFSDIHDSWDILHDFKDTMDKGFDSNVTDSLLQSVRKLSGELETLVAGYYSGVVSAEQLYEALTQHYENDLHNYSEALIKKNELNEEFYNAVGLASEEVTNQFMDDYDVDLKNCKTYAEAKERIELQTLQKISGAWHQYYDAQSQTLKMSMSEIEARATHGGTDAAEFLEQYNNYLAAMEALNNITYEGLKSNFEGIGSKLGANSSGSGSSSDFEETFDWIETAIDRIERSISNLNLKASSVYRSWSERNSNLKAELLDVKKEMDIQASGYNKYMQQANSVGLSEEWASKVRNGQIDINSITDKALAEQIKQYQDYYEKALKCQDAVEDLRESVSKLYETAFDNIVSQFDSILSVIENSKSMLDEQINQAEERGYIANVAYYEALIKVEQQNIEQLTKERTSLQSALADAVNSGAIAEGSEEWADMVKQINDVSLSIEEANTAMLKYGNSIRDIQWQIFDLIQDRISRISSESDFLINLLSYDKQYDERGQLTDTGMSTVGLHGMNYNVYMAQADKYAQEMLRIDKELAKDPYNQDLAKRRQELLELQQEMIIAAEDEKQAIVDMVEEGINLELDALKELIDTYTEALDAQKDLYDYQKNIAKQTEEIASLQKQLSAYEGDLSEEARAKVQQLKVSLENAQEQLEETEYERYISDQKKLLDDLYLEYETALNQRLDNIDSLIADMIASSNANAGMISDVLSSKADSVGYYLSESMEDIWNTNTGSMLDALAMYDSNVAGGFAAVNTSISEVIRGVTETTSGIGNVNTTITNAINSVTANMQAILDRLSSISTMQSASAASSYYGGSGGTSSSGGSTSSSGSSTGNTGFFIYSKNSYPKDKLNIDTSIIDRLRYFDFDSSFSARQMYYSKMGLPGTYTGTADQNAKMIEWMKLNGYKNGVFDLKKDEWAWTQEDGKPEVILNPDGSIIRPDGSVLTPLRQGDSVLNSDATKNLFNFMNDPQRFIRVQSGNIPIPQNDRQEIISNDIQLSIQLPNVQNYEQFKYALQHDRQFEKVVQAMTTGRAAGGSSLKKYKV